MRRLPDGSKAWFERVRQPMGYKIQPCSREGWLVVAAHFVVTIAAIAILLPEPTPPRLWVWGTVEAAATILLLVVCFRMSAPLPPR